MNDKKKSFLLYLDTLEILHKLTDEQAGKLLKAFLAYHSEQDLNLDPMLDLVFFSFQAQFERDGIKYNTIVERNRNNGSKGGRPKNPVKAKEPSGLSGNPSKPKKADSVNGSDSVNDKDSDSVSDSVREVINHLNMVLNSKYKHSTKSHSENISARLNDGHSVNDLKLVIDSKSKEWAQDKKMSQYLRPSTLFQASKFQGYLLSAKPVNNKAQSPKEFSQ